MDKVKADRLPGKFREIEASVAGSLINRDDEVHSAILSVVGGFNCFYLGPPGAAKSAMVNSVLGAIPDARRFHIQMHAGTSPDEVFGPPKISALREDRYERSTEGFLPTAHVAFLDEGFNASSAVLNALLEAMNEHTFTNGAVREEIELSSVFVASNAIPAEVNGELAALWDRLHFRHIVRPLQDADEISALLDLTNNTPPQVKWDDVLGARAEIDAIGIPGEVKRALVEIVVTLASKGITPTARRIRALPKILAAEAWLTGDDVVSINHLEPLCHVLWSSPDDIRPVRQVVQGVTSKPMVAVLKMEAALAGIEAECRAATKGTNASAKKDRLVKARTLAEEALKAAPSGGNLHTRRKVAEITEQIDKVFGDAYSSVMGKASRKLSEAL